MNRTKLLLSILTGTLAAGVGSLFVLFAFKFITPETVASIKSFDGKAYISSLPKMYVILSGSMEPTVPVGSVVVTVPQHYYTTGDVVTFSQSGKKDDLVTHRISSASYPETYFADTAFTTKGDANKTDDRGTLLQSNIKGKVFVTIPYLGYVVDFAKSPKGFLALIVIPATIIIYEELKAMKRELVHHGKVILYKLKRKNDKQQEQINETGSKSSTFQIPPQIAIVPVVAALFVTVALTGSFYKDAEATADNFLGAATSYASTPTPTPPNGSPTPTPTPGIAQTLVINEVLPDSSCFQGQTEAQWFELYNGTGGVVNLKNFKITDGSVTIDVVNSNTNVAAGAFALLAHNTSIWNSCYSDNGVTTANLGGQLNIDTGFLQLLDSNSAVIDTVQWDGSTGLNPNQNESIERNPDGLDTALGVNFAPSDFVVRTTPAPGL